MLSGTRRTLGHELHDLLQAHWQLFLVFCVALLCDAISTSYAMLLRGISGELHPLVRLFSESFGPLTGPLLGAVFKAVAGMTVALYFTRYARLILTMAAGTALLAACYNMWAFQLYLDGIIHFLPI